MAMALGFDLVFLAVSLSAIALKAALFLVKGKVLPKA